MMKSKPKREHVDETCKEIAKVIQTFPKFRFQIFGASNFAIATIKDTERLKNRRAKDNANVIAAAKEYEFVLVVPPLKIRGGTGSALRSFALVP